MTDDGCGGKEKISITEFCSNHHLTQGRLRTSPPTRLMASAHRVDHAPLSNTQTQHTPNLPSCERVFEWVT